MQIIIDGYNLLHAIGYIGNLSEPGKLEQARVTMLDKLSRYMTVAERKQTIVVFDSGHRSQGKLQQYRQHDMQIEFSLGFDNADSKIMELISNHVCPEKLMVVSSDHQIQIAARRRKVEFCDSDVFIDELESREFEIAEQSDEPPRGLREDADYWMALFAGEEIDSIIRDESKTDIVVEPLKDTGDFQDDDEDNELQEGADLDIFPPGYGEDIA